MSIEQGGLSLNLPVHVVGSKWVFRTKFKEDGSVDHYNARIVA